MATGRGKKMCTIFSSYGNLVPKTFYGRLFCIAYGLLGVPLILITVADLGKFLSEHIIWLYTKYLDCKRNILEYLRKRFQRNINARGNFNPLEVIENSTTSQKKSTTFSDAQDELEDLILLDYVSIPVTLVLIILVGYTALGALLLSAIEGWSFFNAFYFSFITMTTVGFGDLVPDREVYLLLDLIYIVIGLAITTMCIDLVGIQYIRKIHYFGRAIQDARYALVNVGGRMVQVGDLMKYAQLLHRRYGSGPDGKNGDCHLIDNPLARLFPHAFIPVDIRNIRYIDYIAGSHESLYSWQILRSEPSPVTNVVNDFSQITTLAGAETV